MHIDTGSGDVEDFRPYFVGDGVLVHNGCRKRNQKSRIKQTTSQKERFKGFHPTTDHKTPADAVKDVITSVDDVINPPKGPGADYNKLLKYFSRHFILYLEIKSFSQWRKA